MLDLLKIGLSVFFVIFGATFAGVVLGRCLPTHHTTDETKRIISLAMAVVGTVSALVLGLLISTANNSFIARSGEVTRISADILRLDHIMQLYGPETASAREVLRKYTAQKTADLFPTDTQDQPRLENPSTYALLQETEGLLLALHPADNREKWLMDQALMISADIGTTRWLLAQRTQQGTPKMLLGLVVLWLALLFASFGLFAERNLTLMIALALCAIAVSGAVEIIVDLEQPFTGLLRISPQPMHHALEVVNQQG